MQESKGLMEPLLSESAKVAKYATPNKKVFAGGATSSAGVNDYAQIPLEALTLLAERFELGEQRHGRDNWKKSISDPGFIRERLNHLIKHAIQLGQGSNTLGDDARGNLGAVLCNGAFLAFALQNFPAAFKEATKTLNPFGATAAEADRRGSATQSSTGCDPRNYTCPCDYDRDTFCWLHAM